MEYVITTGGSFERIEELTTKALEQQGLAVRRTFSLHSAVALSAPRASSFDNTPHSPPGVRGPDYSVLLLYETSARRPIGLLTLFERDGQMIISSEPAPSTHSPSQSDEAARSIREHDAGSLLVSALVAAGLDFCVGAAHGENCLTAEQNTSQESSRLEQGSA